ncbi:MAG: DUF5916 domain-containing protein [Bacteroidetes bacterium]|nr:DUF5916 domain-containing protein [Bacteroidota bacterium]
MNTQISRFVYVALSILGMQTIEVQAQGITEHIVPILPPGVVFDGVVSPDEYAEAIALDLQYEIQPGTNTPAPYSSKGYVFRTEEALIVGFICQFDPENFRANRGLRDDVWDDDFIGMALDVYGDTRNMVFLGANPYAVQLDIRKNNPATALDDEFDLSYDMNYETKAHIGQTSYSVEMRIPFNSIQFGSNPEQRWKFCFFRQTYVQGQQVNVQTYKVDRSNPCNDCLYDHVLILDGLKPSLRRQFIPYVFTAASPEARPMAQFKAGGSAFVALSAATSVEAAVLPDFSQVEADVAQVNVNSAFALFYPERRPFFIEGSDLLESRLKYAYTRTISQPWALSKINYQSQDLRIYVLSGIDQNSPYLVPGENYSSYGASGSNWSTILRAEHPMKNASSFGVLTTHRVFREGGFGHTLAADFDYGLPGNWRVKGEVARSETLEPTADWIDGGETFQGHSAELDGERFNGYSGYGSLRRNSTNWNMRLDYMVLSPTFQAQMGFEPRNNFRRYEFGNSLKFFPNGQRIKQYGVYSEATLFENFEQVVKEKSVLSFAWVQLAGNLTARMFGKYRFEENYLGVTYHDLYSLNLGMNWSPSVAFSAEANHLRGRTLAYNESAVRMGWNAETSVNITLQAAGRFKWSHSLNKVALRELSDPSQFIYRGYLYQTVLNANANQAMGLRLVFQVDNFSEQILFQPLLQYRPSAFGLFYVGGLYNAQGWQAYLKWQQQIG